MGQKFKLSVVESRANKFRTPEGGDIIKFISGTRNGKYLKLTNSDYAYSSEIIKIVDVNIVNQNGLIVAKADENVVHLLVNGWIKDGEEITYQGL